MLTNRFGHRFVVMAGGVLVSTGMITASFARSVVHMYITIGIISGEFSSSQICHTLGLLLLLPASSAGECCHARAGALTAGSAGLERNALRGITFSLLLFLPVIFLLFPSGLGVLLTSAASELALLTGAIATG